MKNIHINLYAEKTATGSSSTIIIRLWTYIPSSLSWIMKVPHSGSADITSGRSIIILTSLALLTEGFLTDIVTTHIQGNSQQGMEKTLQKINLGQLKWKDLVPKFKEYFGKDMTDIATFKTIEALFTLRNNIAHGKTYSEQSVRENEAGSEIINFSPDKKYEQVRKYLIDLQVLNYEIVSANQPGILNSNVATFFYINVKSFLFSVIDSIEFKNKEAMKKELTNSYINCI